MKNDIFDFRRFGKYFLSDLRTCSANFGLSLITLSLITFGITYVFTIINNLIFDEVWAGPDNGLRMFIYAVNLMAVVILMPVKCYGGLTDKKYGSFWLSLPASGMEKFASMLINTIIIAPLAASMLFVGIDALTCLFDQTCGTPVAVSMYKISEILGQIRSTGEFSGERVPESLMPFISQITNGWLYIDDLFGISLPFLLGAIFFKKNKTAKTLLSLFGFGMAASMISAPLMQHWGLEIIESADQIEGLFSHGFFRNVALWDTLSDTVVNLALLTGIWFRIKTLKH